MNENDLKAIIHTVTDYFSQITDIKAEMGLPFIKDKQTGSYDFTGIIGISGARKGGVYLTTGKEMLKDFGTFILGDEELDDEALYDLVGEMTNTITGNLREHFGSAFNISVPIIMKGEIEDIHIRLSPPVFIIPIQWKSYSAYLAIGLE